jgi:hypothetical protein
VLVALALFAAGTAGAQQREDGIFVGPWLLVPGFATGLATDSNVFRLPIEGEETGDQILAASATLTAVLPFRNSVLTMDYTATHLQYNKFQFDRDLAQQGGFDLQFNFSTGDTVETSGAFTLGITDVRQFDPGGEVTFRGEPYNRYVWEAAVMRRVPGRRGYEVRLQAIALNFTNRTNVNFFDYRGGVGFLAYREPVSSRWWLVGEVTIRDFDHYRTTDPVGEVFRREESRLYEIGFRGLAGKRQPLVATLGYGDYQFPGSTSSGFQGLVGQFRWSMPIGAATSVRIGADRRARPSFFASQSHFVADQIVAVFERRFRKYSSIGLDVLIGRNEYGDPEPTFDDVVRKDRRWATDLYFDFKLTRVFGFRVSLTKERRSSNIPRFDYDAFLTFTGITLGWI